MAAGLTAGGAAAAPLRLPLRGALPRELWEGGVPGDAVAVAAGPCARGVEAWLAVAGLRAVAWDCSGSEQGLI